MNRSPSIEERFWPKVDRSGGNAECWPWLAYVMTCGYGRFMVTNGETPWLAHRVSYTLAYGEIPDGLTIDHTCHTASSNCPSNGSCQHRRCVNPAHLEAVTMAENLSRSYANAQALYRQRTQCSKGHPFDESNTIHRSDSGRRCRTCDHDRDRARRAARRLAVEVGR